MNVMPTMATTLSVNEETPRFGEAADMLDVALMAFQYTACIRCIRWQRAMRLRDAREFHDGA